MDAEIKETKNSLYNSINHVFIIGSKGIPAKYGGFETFVEKLTFFNKSEDIHYHISCIVDSANYNSNIKQFTYNNSQCFNIKALSIGAAKAIKYDIDALRYCIAYIKSNKIKNSIIYILACRIGPFIGYYKKKMNKLGIQLFVNPDGHEWKRSKWSALVKKYWKISERYMVKNADLLICDSINIEKYIQEDYAKYKPNTIYIAYGAEIRKSTLSDNDIAIVDWMKKNIVRPQEYYLTVGRFVPENNFENMIQEFMKSSTKKDLVLITNITNNSYYNKLMETTRFDKDDRIKFVGTIYNQELLKKIRENAYGYIHGHEVGGTNPSLLEALASTNLNLLLNVSFNREVGKDCALYWSKEDMSLSRLINDADKKSVDEISTLGELARKRISERYSWSYIIDEYECAFQKICEN